MKLTSLPSTPHGDSMRADPVATDADLAVQLRAGDLRALDELFRRHAADLLRLAAAVAGTDTDAEDVVQDVFVGLPLALRGYEERGALPAWLRGVTIRTALAYRRRHIRRRETALSVSTADRGCRGNPVERLALSDALQRVPDALRLVFTLKMVEGYSHAEIAAMLGIRKGTSEVRLFRAIRHLRSILSEAT